MPALPPVAGVIRLDLIQKDFEDLNMVNHVFIQYTGTPVLPAQLLDFVDAAAASWHTRIMDFQSNGVTLSAVRGTDLSSDTSPTVESPFTFVGGHTDPALSAGAAAVLSHKIARRYRGGHPRTYLGGLVTSQLQDAQSWDSELITDLTAAWANFMSDLIAAAWTGSPTLNPVNVSYFQGFTNHTYPSGRVRPIPNVRSTPLIDVIEDTVVNPKVGSQRRRNKQGS